MVNIPTHGRRVATQRSKSLGASGSGSKGESGEEQDRSPEVHFSPPSVLQAIRLGLAELQPWFSREQKPAVRLGSFNRLVSHCGQTSLLILVPLVLPFLSPGARLRGKSNAFSFEVVREASGFLFVVCMESR